MSGEYHIARSPDEKDALLTVPGAGLTLAEELGLADKTDRVAYGGFGGSYVDPLFGQRSQDSDFKRLRLYADLQRPPSVTKMPGFAGADLSRRQLGDKLEFLVHTRWQSMDAIRSFAGDDVENAVVEHGAVAALIEFDTSVRHYEIVEDVQLR